MLGLGNIGPLAALPVMEGKAALFKRFAGIDAFPICLDTQDVDEIVRTRQGASRPVFAGINLEDISAPRCFEVEARLRERARHPGLPRRPARHRDRRARRADQRAEGGRQGRCRDVRIVMSGRGRGRHGDPRAAARGRRRATSSSRQSTASSHRDRDGPRRAVAWRWIAEHTNPRGVTGDAARRRCAGADVFIGVSAPGILTGDDIATMAPDAIVFALANPDPEVDPDAAARARRRRRDRAQRLRQPDQQRAGVPRRLPRAAGRASRPTIDHGRCCWPPPRRSPAVVADDELNAAYIVPSVFHPDVTARGRGGRRAGRPRGKRCARAGEGGRGPVHDIAGHAIAGAVTAGGGGDPAGHRRAAAPRVPTDWHLAR